MLRRMKADVEIFLPRKQEILLYAPMSEEQLKINKQLLDGTLGVSLGGGGAYAGGVLKRTFCAGRRTSGAVTTFIHTIGAWV